MQNSLTLDDHVWVAKEKICIGKSTKKPLTLAEHDRDDVDRNKVNQAKGKCLPSNIAGTDTDVTIASKPTSSCNALFD